MGGRIGRQAFHSLRLCAIFSFTSSPGPICSLDEGTRLSLITLGETTLESLIADFEQAARQHCSRALLGELKCMTAVSLATYHKADTCDGQRPSCENS